MRKICAHDEVKTATFREIVQDFAFQIQKIDDFLFQKCHDQGHVTRPRNFKFWN